MAQIKQSLNISIVKPLAKSLSIQLSKKQISQLTQKCWSELRRHINLHKLQIQKKIGKAQTQHLLFILTRPSLSLTVSLVDEPESQRLNAFYRKKNKPTDILSFQGEPDFIYPKAKKNSPFPVSNQTEEHLGELAICYPVIRQQAKAHELRIYEELCYMILHGLLHLLSLDHERSKKEEIAMFEIQDHLFEKVRKLCLN